MADQKFSAAQREALWLAHEKKCAYTRELLDVSSFHIDHILPESLAKDPQALEAAKNALGLDPDFDLHGFENLLPCKPGANLQKGSLTLEPAPVHYFLSIAASKTKQIKANLEQIEKRNSRSRALIVLQQCLERGVLSPVEVAKLLEEHGEEPEEMFRLIEHMKFTDMTEVGTIAKADIDDLSNRPIRLGENDHIDGVTLTHGSRGELHVRTCREYDAAIAAGYFPLDNVNLKLSVFFAHQCGLLRALRRARLAEHSFIADPRIGVADLHLLPFSLFPQMALEHASVDPGTTYQSKVDDGTLIVRRVRQNSILVEEPEGMGQMLVEVARADFNEDGLEEILLFEYCYATRGTLGFGGVRTITRKGPTNLLEIADRH